MNYRFHLVWNDATQRHVCAPETARGCGKSRPAKALAPVALLLGALLASSAGAQAMPQGERLIFGDAKITRGVNQMTVTQTGQKAIVQWQSFDIGSGNTVRFIQPNANAIALNRVVAGNASRIDGQLRANGQVWLINPNGVVFGQASQVNVGGLVAATMNITDNDFNDNKAIFTRGAAQGGITNQGHIAVVDGGTLALLAPQVKNEGTLSARLGNVVLAGGDKVTLQAGVDGRLQVAVDPATMRTLIENNNLITADGGQVVMTTSAADALSASMISNAGMVQARTLNNQKGRIMLLGDIRHGEVMHSGKLDASAPESGHGGFVNTFAAKVRIKKGARITTAATQGNTGLWESISKTDLFIHDGKLPATASGIAADALTASLADTNIDLHAQAFYAQKSHIHVNADIRHDRNRLALNADHNIDIDARVSVDGTGTLHLNYGGTLGSAQAPAAADSNLTARRPVDFAKSGNGLLRINGHDVEVIQDLATLQSMGNEARLGGNYALGGTLNAINVDFLPIGNGKKAFTGTFDGLGHSIYDLTVQRPNRSAVGMFGQTTNATLRNVVLERVQVKGKDRVGGLVGAHQAIGGTASISNIRTSGQVQGERAVGGLVGLNLAQNGTANIYKVEVNGKVRGATKRASATGGLIGINEAHSGITNIVDADAKAQTKGKDFVGGLIGVNQAIAGKARITAAFVAGDVSGDSSIGGLIGRNTVASPQGSINIARVLVTREATGVNLVGELIGENQNAGSGISQINNANYSPIKPTMLRLNRAGADSAITP